jgi:PAS domain S-box-containing protein
MVPHDAVADDILRKVAGFLKKGDRAQLQGFDSFPVAMYVTDENGYITYFNHECVEFAGRQPTTFQDRWCVTWKLYTNDGDFLPHDKCPMAVAIQTKQAVRGITAVAERPDGSRINFLPFPTPVLGEHGELLSAINMLVDITGHTQTGSQEHRYVSTDAQDDRVTAALSQLSIEEIRGLVDEMEMRLSPKPPRILN